jgi:hypothetical protein
VGGGYVIEPLDLETERRIVHAAGCALKLSVPILCMVKIEFNDDEDKHVPLGSILVVPLLLLRHLPMWWWRKGRVYDAVRTAAPPERQVIVYSMSKLPYEYEMKVEG